MAITLKGIRLESVTMKRNKESEKIELEGAVYSLISSVDKVLAQQTVGGYNNLTVTPSADTLKAMEAFLTSYKKDITAALGLEEA